MFVRRARHEKALHHARRKAAVALAGTVALVVAPVAASAGVAQPRLVSTVPLASTPEMTAGYIVHDDAVVKGRVFVGGQFTAFSQGGVTYPRHNFLAYDVRTGKVSPLVLNFDKDVYAFAATSDGSALYIGGAFRTVNGLSRGSLVKVNLATGKVDTAFKGPGGVVQTLQYSKGRLFVGGTFAKRLVALNPTTGADTGAVRVTVSGTLGLGGGAVRVTKLAINPAGTDLVAIGNFVTVNGFSRRSAFRLQLVRGSWSLTSWHPVRFDSQCATAVPNYLRDVDWSPDGSYFGIVSTGGPVGYPAHGFCDAAGRWDASSSGPVAQPRWINFTGGDSIYSLAISGAGIYVGGHMRWLDNPDGHDSAGANAYEVDGIGVINPQTGLADRTWNARYMDRRHGKEDLTLFDGGLVVGGDGHYLKGYHHVGTGIFPL